MVTLKKPSPPPNKGARLSVYQRNMAAMRAFKESHPCCECRMNFPHPIMHFLKKGEWSISRLAGSRCSLEDLEKAMANAPLYCAACLPAAGKPGRKKSK